MILLLSFINIIVIIDFIFTIIIDIMIIIITIIIITIIVIIIIVIITITHISLILLNVAAPYGHHKSLPPRCRVRLAGAADVPGISGGVRWLLDGVRWS